MTSADTTAATIKRTSELAQGDRIVHPSVEGTLTVVHVSRCSARPLAYNLVLAAEDGTRITAEPLKSKRWTLA